MERVRRRVEDLDRLTATRRPLDADRRRLVERDRDAVVVGERRLDHLPLNLAVQRDGDLFRFGAGKAGTSAPCRLRRAYAGVVLADVDQRVLLRQLPERDAQPLRLGRIDRLHHRLERRRREVVLGCRGAARRASRRSGSPRGPRASRSRPREPRPAARRLRRRRRGAPSPCRRRSGRGLEESRRRAACRRSGPRPGRARS